MLYYTSNYHFRLELIIHPYIRIKYTTSHKVINQVLGPGWWDLAHTYPTHGTTPGPHRSATNRGTFIFLPPASFSLEEIITFIANHLVNHYFESKVTQHNIN